MLTKWVIDPMEVICQTKTNALSRSNIMALAVFARTFFIVQIYKKRKIYAKYNVSLSKDTSYFIIIGVVIVFHTQWYLTCSVSTTLKSIVKRKTHRKSLYLNKKQSFSRRMVRSLILNNLDSTNRLSSFINPALAKSFKKATVM